MGNESKNVTDTFALSKTKQLVQIKDLLFKKQLPAIIGTTKYKPDSFTL